MEWWLFVVFKIQLSSAPISTTEENGRPIRGEESHSSLDRRSSHTLWAAKISSSKCMTAQVDGLFSLKVYMHQNCLKNWLTKRFFDLKWSRNWHFGQKFQNLINFAIFGKNRPFFLFLTNFLDSPFSLGIVGQKISDRSYNIQPSSVHP